VKRLPEKLLLALMAAYQRWISPAFPRRCKYHPTCSDYAVQAVRELGVLRGSIVASWRLLRCNPLSDGGVDDLADRRLFRGRAAKGAAERPRSSASEAAPGPRGGAQVRRVGVAR
jgi:putative membrane protein insertion efficiency factor